jgi:hypothetical protein
VFNAEYQIKRLHDEGRFHTFATVDRRRYNGLAGHFNPSISHDVEAPTGFVPPDIGYPYVS